MSKRKNITLLVVLLLIGGTLSGKTEREAAYWVPVKCMSGNLIDHAAWDNLLSEESRVSRLVEEYTRAGRKETTALLERGTRFFPMIEAHLHTVGLPEGLKYLPMVESGLRTTARSRAGAVGLWQFMPGTARQYGLVVNDTLDERQDPERSTQAAVRLLADLFDQFGDWRLALSAYNCGPGRVKRLQRQAGQEDFAAIRDLLPQQTQHYIDKFIAATYTANHYAAFQIRPFLSRNKKAATQPTKVRTHSKLLQSDQQCSRRLSGDRQDWFDLDRFIRDLARNDLQEKCPPEWDHSESDLCDFYELPATSTPMPRKTRETKVYQEIAFLRRSFLVLYVGFGL